VIANVLPLLLLLLQSTAPEPRIQRGVLVRPDTVTVGDPFIVAVRIRAPRGAAIEFPSVPDSGGVVEAIDPLQVTTSADTTASEQTAYYRLAAWDIGRRSVALEDVLVKMGAVTRRVSLADLSVFVRSVLPADSARRVPKPARDVLDVGPPWWWWLVAALAVIAIIGIGYWWYRRRRQRVRNAPPDPLADAEREFDRVESLGLVAAGERTRHAALMVEILREYLSRVIPAAAVSLTTTEALASLRNEAVVPTNRLAAVLSEVDLIKFARRAVAPDRALEIGREARAIVRDVEAARHPDLTSRAA
jgi:hypothetical protein